MIRTYANQVINECDSTNLLARELGEAGSPHGTWVSARKQLRGRGRLGREWKSEKGNLFLSIVLRPTSKKNLTWIPLAVAVAVSQVLKKKFPKLPVQVKWPNDLWIGGEKVGGILCESLGSANSFFLIVGLGLNCESTPDVPGQKVTSLQKQGCLVDLDLFRMEVVSAIIHLTDKTIAQGGPCLVQLYHEFSFFKIGDSVTWTQDENRCLGQILGLGSYGELRVRLSTGEEKSLYAEEVSVRR